MAKFIYKNATNASFDYTLFELNCNYHLGMSYKENVNSRSKSKFSDELLAELRKLMIIWQKNLHNAQKL